MKKELSRAVFEDAYILIARNGLSALTDIDACSKEQCALVVDKKTKMRGRVVNKIARHNLCFAETSQEPDYELGKGRVYAFKDLPYLSEIQKGLPHFFGSKAENLVAEGNYYYDPKKCGIGPHGDSERRVVIGIRLGQDMPLDYHWYQNSKPFGPTFSFVLGNGDLYAMSDKASGYNWKKKIVPTLRHAAGAAKYRKFA